MSSHLKAALIRQCSARVCTLRRLSLGRPGRTRKPPSVRSVEIPPLATDNLLKNTDGVLPGGGVGAPHQVFSRGGSLLLLFMLTAALLIGIGRYAMVIFAADRLQLLHNWNFFVDGLVKLVKHLKQSVHKTATEADDAHVAAAAAAAAAASKADVGGVSGVVGGVGADIATQHTNQSNLAASTAPTAAGAVGSTGAGAGAGDASTTATSNENGKRPSIKHPIRPVAAGAFRRRAGSSDAEARSLGELTGLGTTLPEWLHAQFVWLLEGANSRMVERQIEGPTLLGR